MNFFHSAFFKKLRSGATIDPTRDWIIVVTLSIMILAVIVIWSIWTFDMVVSGKTIGAPAPKAPPVFDSASLDTVHTVFENRATEDAKYVSGVYRFADPSH